MFFLLRWGSGGVRMLGSLLGFGLLGPFRGFRVVTWSKARDGHPHQILGLLGHRVCDWWFVGLEARV